MNPTLLSNEPGLPVFVKFEVQRCIRVMFGVESQYLPIDPRQVEGVLEPVRNETTLDEHPNLSLILSQQPGGVQMAMIDHCDGDVYLAADAGQDPHSEVSMARFAGEAWRVVGCEDGFPNEPYQLMTSESMLAAQSVCNGLQALLKPVRVALGMDGGSQSFIFTDRAAEVLVMDSAYAIQNKESGTLVINSPYLGHENEYAGEVYRGNLAPEAVSHFWGQVKAFEEPSTEVLAIGQ
ncbi:hypothetical protein PVE_R2G0543 [Pseudomonas veronii 1YdBTEX2]|uniref:Uncharacterized protein n=1 Tax=Pseudomonas veronii 1YdBTEX2 TaxID=1295141 RepID=A0A1D3K8D5_PSEVE|nr:hypothetical protein PVE_R2G0543 [Pseudomonas veronii 1YdBTEX2]